MDVPLDSAWEDWQIEDELTSAAWLLGVPLPTVVPGTAPADAPHGALADLVASVQSGASPLVQNGSRSPRAAANPVDRTSRSSTTSGWGWGLLTLGTAAFACGLALLGWAVVGQRGDLWSWGIPLALVGQLVILAGVAVQLERMWASNHRTEGQLVEIDQHIDDLRSATRHLAAGPHAPGQAFYAHLVEGASPQLLLADLKSQLDLLALRMSRFE